MPTKVEKTLPDAAAACWEDLPPELLEAILTRAREKTVWRARRLAHEVLKAKLTMDDDQLNAVMAALRGESIVLVGAAGSGKTHVLKTLRKKMSGLGYL
jgi:superfamily I DNA and RNA helicase